MNRRVEGGGSPVSVIDRYDRRRAEAVSRSSLDTSGDTVRDRKGTRRFKRLAVAAVAATVVAVGAQGAATKVSVLKHNPAKASIWRNVPGVESLVGRKLPQVCVALDFPLEKIDGIFSACTNGTQVTEEDGVIKANWNLDVNKAKFNEAQQALTAQDGKIISVPTAVGQIFEAQGTIRTDCEDDLSNLATAVSNDRFDLNQQVSAPAIEDSEKITSYSNVLQPVSFVAVIGNQHIQQTRYEYPPLNCTS
jgi:hypothetical protein